MSGTPESFEVFMTGRTDLADIDFSVQEAELFYREDVEDQLAIGTLWSAMGDLQEQPEELEVEDRPHWLRVGLDTGDLTMQEVVDRITVVDAAIEANQREPLVEEIGRSWNERQIARDFRYSSLRRGEAWDRLLTEVGGPHWIEYQAETGFQGFGAYYEEVVAQRSRSFGETAGVQSQERPPILSRLATTARTVGNVVVFRHRQYSDN